MKTGKFIADERVSNGVTISLNKFSAPWRRLWWITDIGHHGAEVRRALIEAAGVNPNCVSSWAPNVSFPNAAAACAAIAKATGSRS